MALPSAVMGPWDFWPLAREARSWASEIIGISFGEMAYKIIVTHGSHGAKTRMGSGLHREGEQLAALHGEGCGTCGMCVTQVTGT